MTLGTDPKVKEVGIDTGYSPDGRTVRAPDLAVGNVPHEPGWVKGVPPLAVEYADTGQDEADLKLKINELLRGGTQHIWVVRLTGPRRVEIHEPGKAMRTAKPGQYLEAPGILKNSVLVEALYEPQAAKAAALRNLVQTQGYDSFEAALAESVARGRSEGEIRTHANNILEVLEARN